MNKSEIENLKLAILQGFEDNKSQHEKITKCLFGNGEVGIVGKVARHYEILSEIKEIHETILTKLETVEMFNQKQPAVSLKKSGKKWSLIIISGRPFTKQKLRLFSSF